MQVCTFFYFSYFLILVPFTSWFELSILSVRKFKPATVGTVVVIGRTDLNGYPFKEKAFNNEELNAFLTGGLIDYGSDDFIILFILNCSIPLLAGVLSALFMLRGA